MGTFREAEKKAEGGRFRQLDRKPNATKDSARSFGGGLVRGLASLGDAVMQATPGGLIESNLRTAANIADTFGGKKATQPAAPYNRLSQEAARITPKPETRAGRYAGAIGEMTVNALAPGGLARRGAAVVLPAVAGEGVREQVEAGGGNQLAQAGGQLAGNVLGGFGAAARVNRLSPRAVAPEEKAAKTLRTRAKADPVAMRQKADQMRKAGVAPTITDVVGEKGRRVIRAVGVKDDVAGEKLVQRARSVSTTAKPAIMARTQQVGPERGKTADEVKANVESARDNAARTNYRDAYAAPIPVTDDVAAVLSDAPGKAALRQARADALERRDVEQVAEIDALLSADSVPPQVSGATLDRTQIALRERANALARNNKGARAAGARDRRAVVNQALDNAPGLQTARADYRAKSQAIDVLGKGRKDVFSTDPADYGRWLQGLSPEAREANKVAIRQEILDTLGGQRSSTFGTVDELATSEYARANLRQALGGEADDYLANLEARLEQVRNARFVSPNDGSRTAVLDNDLQGVMRDTVEVGANIASGNKVGLALKAADWFARRGIRPEVARALGEAAEDPAKLEQIIAYLERTGGPRAAQAFISWRNAALLGASAGAAAMRPEPTE